MATLELTNNLLAEIGGWPALKEARALVERGRVRNARRDGTVVRARVQGAEKVYEAQIMLADRMANIEVRCTCVESRRTGRVCAHVLAAGLAQLGSRRPPGDGAIATGEPSPGGRRLPTASLPGTAAATTERSRIIFSWRPDGALELTVETRVPSRPMNESDGTPAEGGLPSLPIDRIISRAQIPDFLTREFPGLERTCELAFAPGSEEFRLEIRRPAFEARLDGALSGLTLELIARYGDIEFSLTGKTESSAYQKYFSAASNPGPKNPVNPVQKISSIFWRRSILAEREALAEVAAVGFSLIRGGAATFSLISENRVARFLANTLPRWRHAWTVGFGSRLKATLAEIDVAQPEFSLRPGSGNDWLSLDLKLSVQGKPVPLDQAEIQRWLQTGQTHARTVNKRVLLVPTEAWSEMKEVLADCEVDQEPGKIRVARTFAPYLAGALTAQGFRVGENVAVDSPPPDVKAMLDEKLWAQLRPYQAHGVEWLAGLAQRNFHGLLADDMGLGKTLQALAFCAWVRGRDGSPLPSLVRSATDTKGLASLPQGTLVVCPTSLVTNWLREAARFTPQLRTLDLTGADRAEKFGRRKEYDLLVTSYAILRRDIEHYRVDEFSLVILDEAQHIKNRGSQNAQSAKALRARHRLILTGTPLENSVLDLWSLYDFLLPGYLGTAADFRERYETPLTRGPISSGNSEIASCRPVVEGRSRQHTHACRTRTANEKLMERLRYRVRPFFLRRTKEEVLTELPPKLEFLTLCELTDEQREVYRAVLAQGRREVFEHSGKSGKGRDRIAVLTTLLRLRQVCCHLDLLPEGEEGGTEGATELRGHVRSQMEFGNEGTEEGRSGMSEDSALQPSSFTLPPSSARWKEPSAKMDRTFELIDEAMDGGHRVLLFSQFVRVLHLLRDEAKRRELRFCYLDGQTVERQAEVDRFQQNEDVPLFFISLKAGGTGLNLTGADTVIHFDPWWNPAVEEQATSRAHRMGQARSVQAYKLIAAGTVEEKIQALQARKRELFQASLGSDAAFVDKLTGDDLEELLAE